MHMNRVSNTGQWSNTALIASHVLDEGLKVDHVQAPSIDERRKVKTRATR